MNKSVILGQFDESKIRNLVQNCPSKNYMIECDLTRVYWPLVDGELKSYSHPISSKGNQWVICVDGHQVQILSYLQDDTNNENDN